MSKRILIAFAVCLAVAAPAFPQALTSLASVRVGYNTRKNTVKPQGELKAQIDALDQQIADATRLGHTGELRRLFAKGLTLLAGREWTDAADYNASLVIRTDRVVADSTRPYNARLEQLYQPAIALQRVFFMVIYPLDKSSDRIELPFASASLDTLSMFSFATPLELPLIYLSVSPIRKYCKAQNRRLTSVNLAPSIGV